MIGRSVRTALLADGSSDRALLPLLLWLVRRLAPAVELPQPGFRARLMHADLTQEMQRTIQEFRPDILFVHRDAESQDPETRRAEIPPLDNNTLVRVVPVRMSEAWLLFHESAIRRAADRRQGKAPLHLPPLSSVEGVSDPKAQLRCALLTAAEVSGRQRKRFTRDIAARVHRVAELIDDFTPLLKLEAFRRLEADCKIALAAWCET